MTADILTPGHLRVIQECATYGRVFVGLLTDRALKKYKNTIFSYKERKEILDSIKYIYKVLPQRSLNCFNNLVKYKINFVASGDGFEPEELEAIKRAKCKKLDIRFKGEKKNGKLFSSTLVKKKICEKLGYSLREGAVLSDTISWKVSSKKPIGKLSS
jgi:cytidyltransferase-like protein